MNKLPMAINNLGASLGLITLGACVAMEKLLLQITVGSSGFQLGRVADTETSIT